MPVPGIILGPKTVLIKPTGHKNKTLGPQYYAPLQVIILGPNGPKDSVAGSVDGAAGPCGSLVSGLDERDDPHGRAEGDRTVQPRGHAELVAAQLDLRGLEDEHPHLIGGERERVVQPLEETHLHDADFTGGVAEGVGDAGVGDGGSVVPEFDRYQGTCEKQVEQLVVLDSVLRDEPIGIEDDGNKHVAWELVDFEEVQKDNKELVQGVLHLGEGVGEEVLAVVLLNPRYAELEEKLAGERGIRAEPKGFHG